MAKNATDLKTAAVRLDKLADPRLAAEGQRLLALLDKHAADMAKAPRRARMAVLLSENNGSIANLLSALRLKVEDAEALKDAVSKEDARLQRQKKTLDDVLQPTTTALMSRASRLRDDKLGLEQRIRNLNNQRLKAIDQLMEAGLACEEAQSRAKPEQSAISELSEKLEALPTIGDNIQWRLRSYVHRLQMQEQAKSPKELVA